MPRRDRILGYGHRLSWCTHGYYSDLLLSPLLHHHKNGGGGDDGDGVDGDDGEDYGEDYSDGAGGDGNTSGQMRVNGYYMGLSKLPLGWPEMISTELCWQGPNTA